MSSPSSGAGQSRSRRERATAALAMVAGFGQASILLGNAYEAITKIPDRLAASPDRLPGAGGTVRMLLRPGTPLRYYLPAAPITAAATVGAVVTGWQTPMARGWLAASCACVLTGGVLTAHLVRTVNLPLFFAAQPLPAAEQQELLHRWYRLNSVRLLVFSAAWLTSQQARRRLRT